MPLYEPYLPIRYVKPLLAMLAQQSTDLVARVLQTAQLDAAKLQLGATTVTFNEFDRLVCATAETLDMRDLGFQLGKSITIDDHDALGFVLRQCRTMDQLLRTVARFRKLITNGFFFIYQRDASYGELIFRPAAPLGKEALHMFEELFAVSTHTDVTALTANEPGLEIFLSMPEPAHADRYRLLRPTRFHFEASALPEVRCRLPARLLDRPLMQPAGAGAVSVGELRTGAHLSERSADYAKWVTLMLREAEGVQPRLNELATMLNISTRSLNRYLMAEGTTLRDLGTATRFERAKILLRHSDEAITQIAYRLGYASPTSFYVAFSKCAKIGPREFRKLGK
ncbi:MAG: AraC family transcriptional regulator ligand-binding domain-containing protein [Pseudomonadota bacterium]